MSENLRPFPTEIPLRDIPRAADRLLRPGGIVRVSDVTQLHLFEELIAEQIDLKHDHALWAGRERLSDLIRPSKFNGSIVDLELEVMQDPYGVLLDIQKEGRRFVGNRRQPTEASRDRIEQGKGFMLMATPRSSGRGAIGQIQAEIFYYPTDLHDTYRRGFSRLVTKPILEVGDFKKTNKRPEGVDLMLLKDVMGHSVED